MENLKILHFADSHLRDDENLPEIKECLEYIVEQARQIRPDLIICAGDIFDSRYVRLDSLSAKLAFTIFSDLADVAPVAIVGGTPSHEGSATEVFCMISAKYPIWVSTTAEQIFLDDDGRMFIDGNDQAASEVAKMMAGFGAMSSEYRYGAPHVLVGHFQVGGALVSETQV